jgi:hypothetical protein
MADKSYLRKILDEGNEKANEAALKTMNEVKKALKF